MVPGAPAPLTLETSGRFDRPVPWVADGAARPRPARDLHWFPPGLRRTPSRNYLTNLAPCRPAAAAAPFPLQNLSASTMPSLVRMLEAMPYNQRQAAGIAGETNCHTHCAIGLCGGGLSCPLCSSRALRRVCQEAPGRGREGGRRGRPIIAMRVQPSPPRAPRRVRAAARRRRVRPPTTHPPSPLSPRSHDRHHHGLLHHHRRLV